MKPRDSVASKPKHVNPKEIRQEMKALGMARKERQEQQHKMFKPVKEQAPKDKNPEKKNTEKGASCSIS